ncbi:MAG: response regulator [Nodosilinea sp.]
MPKRIFAVDDEPFILTIVQLCLESFAGWQVTPCCTEQAFEQVGRANWDAILLEVGSQSGEHLFRQLQAEPTTQAIPVVFLTSRVMPLEMARYHALGVTEVIAKPFDPQKLGTDIAARLGWSTCLAA